MIRFVPVAAAVALLLAACVPAPAPSPTGSTSPSATSTSTGSPTAAPSITPTPTATPVPPPSPRPSRVTGLTAMTGGGSGEVLLRWNQNPEPTVVSYVVLRSLTSGGTATRIGTVTRQQVTQFEYVPFVDSRATVAYYRVRAVGSDGQQGPDSAEVCGAAPGFSC